MATDIFDFQWNVPEKGYTWVHAKVMVDEDGKPSNMTNKSRPSETVDWILTDNLPIGSAYFMNRYMPLKSHTGLFRVFGEIPQLDQNAILSFANEYGDLGIRWPITSPDKPETWSGNYGERQRDWVEQIDAMRRALQIWDLLQAKNATGLNRFIRWRDEEHAPDGKTVTRSEGWFYNCHPDLPPITKDPHRGVPPAPGPSYEWIKPVDTLFTPGDVIMPAVFLLQKWVNNHLPGNVGPRLLYDAKNRKEDLRLVPENLLGALWLQLAQGIAGNKEFRTCKLCSKWFELSSKQIEHRTIRREFCSDSCKSRDYRQRKQLTLKLKAAGKTPKDIAKETNTDLPTIKNWLSKRKA